jgi:hypothetical protein
MHQILEEHLGRHAVVNPARDVLYLRKMFEEQFLAEGLVHLRRGGRHSFC